MDLLDGISVIEVGSTVVGPYSTQVLAAMGADVVKVEPPSGDPFRGDREDEQSVRTYFAMCNCEKRSLQLNLKEEAGREAFLTLAAEADVVIENFRPGVADRLGVGYDDVRDASEDIIYCSISGFGSDSQLQDRAAFDPMLQAMTGLMSTTGERGGKPTRIGVALIDLTTGLWSAIAVLGALQDRTGTDDGSFIDMSMYDVGVSLLTKKAAYYFENDENPPRMGLGSLGSHPYTGYPTADDKMVMVGAPFPSHWVRFCTAIDREDLLEDDRFQTNQDRLDNRDELDRILEDVFRTKSRSEWEDIFLDNNLPVGPIYTVEEALENEITDDVIGQVEHPNYGSVDTLNLPLKIDGERQQFEGAPPKIGEHSREILAEKGLSEETISELEEHEII
jgi:crotonobetainyl-CoA:carnitine CoA-transferase CaiB-like acyl-CoA transferase